MNQPTIDELLRHVDSKYALVVLAAKRARMLTEQGLVKDKSTKPVTIALHEISQGKVKFQKPKAGLK